MARRPQQPRIGIPWFRPTDYHEVRRLCPELPVSFKAWRYGARHVEHAAIAQGVSADKVYVSADDLAAYLNGRAPAIGSEVLIDWCQGRIEDAARPPAGDIQERFRREMAREVAARRKAARHLS